MGMVGSCVVTFQTVLYFDGADRSNGFWKNVEFLLGVFGWVLCWWVPFIYPVSRITLLILAVTSLRSLPHSAFDTVDWVELVPHF